jgi:hypothetical protein
MRRPAILARATLRHSSPQGTMNVHADPKPLGGDGGLDEFTFRDRPVGCPPPRSCTSSWRSDNPGYTFAIKERCPIGGS